MSLRPDDGGEYIDYEAFLSPDFKPSSFANTLVLSTNNTSDIPLDLATPLSRVLFDIQEIDSHIDTLATKSAVPLLAHTKTQANASARILEELDSQVTTLNDTYAQLEKDVIQKHAEADQVRRVASRLWESLRLSRAVSRCLQLGRQLQLQLAEAPNASSLSSSRPTREDHTAIVRCANTILSIREMFERTAPGEEGHDLDRIIVVQTLQKQVIVPGQESVLKTAESIVRDFYVPGSGDTSTNTDIGDARNSLASGLATLYLLSPSPRRNDRWSPVLMVQVVELHLRQALQASIAALGRGLGQFTGQIPMLEKSLGEVTWRCRTVLHLEGVLEYTKAPRHPLVGEEQLKQGLAKDKGNLLQSVLTYLETGSLASYFWRTLASSLSTRVQEMVQRGSSSARHLRTNRSPVERCIRDCVLRGCEISEPVSSSVHAGKADKAAASTTWEREIAVMVGSVVNNLGR